MLRRVRNCRFIIIIIITYAEWTTTELLEHPRSHADYCDVTAEPPCHRMCVEGLRCVAMTRRIFRLIRVIAVYAVDR